MKNTTETKTQEPNEHIRWEIAPYEGRFGFVGKVKAFYAYESASSPDITVLLCHLPEHKSCNDPCYYLRTQKAAEVKAEEIFAQWLDSIGLEVKKTHRCDTCQKWLDEVCP